MDKQWKSAAVLAVVIAATAGGYLYGRHAVTTAESSGKSAQKIQYTCPMHPFIIYDRPGTCPICAMELVRKIKGTLLSDKELQALSHVALSPSQQVMANLATAVAAVKPFSREIAATGVVAYNQERQGKVSAWLAGRLDRLLVGSVGAQVIKNRPVAEIYSYEFVLAQEEYLLAHKALKLFQSSIVPTYTQTSQTSLFEARQRLRQLGFREEQFEQLDKSGRPTVRIPIYSPLSGVITEKLVQEGQYVNVGDPLFSVADLSRIWVELELYEGDFPFIRKGQEVAITSKSYPAELFHGRVTFIYPFLDPKTRTVRVRVTLPNPGLKLKPDMFVSATIKVPMADSLVVPAEAVMDTGKRQVVWVEWKPGVFILREVKTGARSAAGVQVLAGLKAGEKVAATGGYLIDSEAQLSHGGEAPAQPAAPPTRKDGMETGGGEKSAPHR
ncbi:MAG: Cu(I)/Ag(I) efflux system membrane protein [Geobacteraceae bacterium]|nr:MAG: Cu(I)/Ag(I) efflux system membrane protein [Geobacteraceae bacterium]